MCRFCGSLFVLFLLAIVLSVLLRYTDSDNFLLLLQAQVCKKCGSILSPCLERPPSSNAAVSAESERKWTCSLCKQTDTIDIIKVPYVFKYLVAELAAINIKVNLEVKAF